MRFFLFSSAVDKKILKLKARYMEALQLNGSDLPVFLVLSLAEQPMTLKEIGIKASLDKAQISRAIRKMSDQGMIHKQGSGGYKALYSLSGQGRIQANTLNASVGEIVSLAHATITDEQWDAYYRFADDLLSFLGQIETISSMKDRCPCSVKTSVQKDPRRKEETD